MGKVRFLFAAFLFFVATVLQAQMPAQPVRLELPLNAAETWVEVIPVPDSSLLLYHKTSNAWGSKSTFHFTKYDARLEETWAAVADLHADAEFVRHYTEAPYTYLVFRENIENDFSFVRLHLKTGDVQLQKYKLSDINAIYEFNVLQGRYFLIGRNPKNGKPILLFKNPNQEETKILPSVYGDESTFSDLLTDHANGRVDAVMSESNGRVSRLQLKSFDANGNLLRSNFILPQNEKSLLNAEATPGDSTTQLLLGNYGTRDIRYTQGFFTAATNLTSEVYFYNLLQLKNFFKYLKPRREERTRKREAARLKAGQEPTNRYRLLLHDLLITPTGYVLAAEVYFPNYSNGNSGLSRTINYKREASIYKRTHAVALGFDKNGLLLWDNAFPIKNVETTELVHAVEVGYKPDGKVIIAYPKDKVIHYRIFDQDQYTTEETEVELLPYAKDEKITETQESYLVNWYGGNFAAYGFQRIRTENGPMRSVFYINKLNF
ncbi:hypothetical protein [Pontibacter arcticus]|uniref:Uncharacterized protein n=1 Tax=Pontibacter arcticus TaxID=2080288 RepID=A0A364RHD5_9BACT|nr:hypothetical protein [Pontibacter arcticus]RAU83711.1 hypothetical protein DP923_01160 [Pontibacter arcticus]